METQVVFQSIFLYIELGPWYPPQEPIGLSVKLVPAARRGQGPNSIEKKSTEKPLEFPLEIPYTKKKVKNG